MNIVVTLSGANAQWRALRQPPYVESRGPFQVLAAHWGAPAGAPRKGTDVHVSPGYLEGETGQEITASTPDPLA